MNYPVDQWDFILTMMMLKKLDNDNVTCFEMEHRSSKMPNYEDLKKFLNNEPRTTNLFVDKPPARSPAKSCIFVRPIMHCIIAPHLPQNRKVNVTIFVKRRSCFNCLSSAHDLKSCRSTYQYKIYHSRYHHTLLCSKTQASGLGHAGAVRPMIAANVPAGSELHISETIPDFTSTSLLVDSGVVLLSTAWIDICYNRGQYQSFRCLLDSGSMISFITRKAVSKLGLCKSDISIEVRVLGLMRSQANKGSSTQLETAEAKLSACVYRDSYLRKKL
ncbi:hypothetical protein JTB14_016428 [Gonioctena quinquepunctata]|nr:hypothetical protein JTB14_016428 [Gonioctena quinquepunctata]